MEHGAPQVLAPPLPASPIAGAYRELAEGIRELAESVRAPGPVPAPERHEPEPDAPPTVVAPAARRSMVRTVLGTLLELFVVMFLVPVVIFHFAMLLFPPAR